jgi:hypothetical protein
MVGFMAPSPGNRLNARLAGISTTPSSPCSGSKGRGNTGDSVEAIEGAREIVLLKKPMV